MARAALPPPRLTVADRDRLRSLHSRTVTVRSELRLALGDLKHAANALQSAATHGESADDELRSLISAAAKDVGRHLDDLALGVRRFERQLGERPERLVAAFFGRTMAGKTTLVETLVGGDGAAIGRGGQRTTRETRRCLWGDIALYDTPGIGAFDGEEDARIARRDVREADLVVFVITDDSIQEEHLRGLEHIKDENKPVLFLLNAKLAVDDPLLRKRFLSDPDAFLGEAAVRGHLERLDELAREQLGLTEYRVLSVQAQAAWLGSTEGDVELLTASRLGQAVVAVTELVTTKAVYLRVRSTYDPSILQLERTGRHLAGLTAELRQQSGIYLQRASAFERQLDQLFRTHQGRVQRTITTHLAARRAELVAWLDEHIAAKDLTDRLEEWLAIQSLEQQLRRDIEEAFRTLESICASALGQLLDDLELHVTVDFHQESFQFTDWRKALAALRRTLQVGGLLFKVARLTKWGKRLGGAGGPVGWVVLVGTEVLALLARRFPRHNLARRVYLQKAAGRLQRSLVQLEQEASKAACEPVDDVITKDMARRLLEEFTASANQLASHAADLNVTVVRIRDQATRLSASMCEDLLDGQGPNLWCRLPGEVLAVRGTLQEGVRAALHAALGEVVLELPGSATDAIRRAAPGWAVAWREDSLRLSHSGVAPLDEVTRSVIEYIAERPVIAVTDDQPKATEEP
jgi:hypothetical protein